MSDNDLISRMALYEKTAKWEAQALHMVEIHMHDEDTTEWRKWSTILTERSAFKFDVADAPAVPQEMTAREYVHTSNRMLKEDYRAWDRLMVFEDNDDADKAIAWMEEWAREHPERSKR